MLSSKQIIKILKQNEFVLKSTKGSHTKFVYKDKIVIVPHPTTDIPMGTFLSIVRQSGLKKSDFITLH